MAKVAAFVGIATFSSTATAWSTIHSTTQKWNPLPLSRSPTKACINPESCPEGHLKAHSRRIRSCHSPLIPAGNPLLCLAAKSNQNECDKDEPIFYNDFSEIDPVTATDRLPPDSPSSFSKAKLPSEISSTPSKNEDSRIQPTKKENPINTLLSILQTNPPQKSIQFSILMALCGAILGPFLDSYHSLFGVLSYDTPLKFPLLGGSLTLVTTYWVPPLFALAGFLIGWLYIWLDAVFYNSGPIEMQERQEEILDPSIPKVLVGISFFTFQYWLSGVLSANGVDRSTILTVMSVLAAGGFYALDGTTSGLITSVATAVGGPLIEVGLISFLPYLSGDVDGGAPSWAYHYNDAGETGFFPLWIIPVYFLGGPANGNLARAFWNALEKREVSSIAVPDDEVGLLPTLPKSIPCSDCQGTRAVFCPNCDDGTYFTYDRRVVCKACRGKGRVICRTCFDQYGDDPNDIENIRRIMDRIPD